MDNVPNVKTQGNIESCIANAFATMYEAIMDRNVKGIAGRNFVPSRLYLYFWLRNFAARHNQNGGYMPDAIEVLQNKGVCSEASWPYDISKQNIQPPNSCDVEAERWAVHDCQNLALNTQRKYSTDFTLTNIKHALASGRPVVMAMPFSRSIEALSTQKNWRTHAGDPYINTLYSHAVCVIGYDDSVGRLLIQNSYGPEWGDGGFFGLEYKHITSINFTLSCSAWCVLRLPGGVFFEPAPGYIKKVYDPARKQQIITLTNAQLQPLKDLAKQHNIGSDEIDTAMTWPEGTWDKIK